MEEADTAPRYNYDYAEFNRQAENQNFKFEVPSLSGLPSFKGPVRSRSSSRQGDHSYEKQPARSEPGYSSDYKLGYNNRYNEVQTGIENRFKKPDSDRVQGDEFGDYSDYNYYWDTSDDIENDEDMLRAKYPGFGDINTQHQAETQPDTRYGENKQPVVYEEKRSNVLKPVVNTVAAAPVEQDWDVEENVIETVKKQPIRRMHRPKSSHVRNNQAAPQTNSYQTHTNQQTNKAPSYERRKPATKKVVINPYEYKNTKMEYDTQPRKVTRTRKTRYPDLTSDNTAKYPAIVAQDRTPVNTEPYQPRQKESQTEVINERSSSPPRLSKISTRQVTDSQEEASHHTHHLPQGRGSLEAAVAAGAAGYNAVC